MAQAIKRRNVEVMQLHVEINHALYERLTHYVSLYRMSQRDIVAEALLIWLNSQDAVVNKKEVS